MLVNIKEEALKFVRRLAFVFLVPLIFSSGIVLTQKVFETTDMYISLSVGVRE